MGSRDCTQQALLSDHPSCQVYIKLLVDNLHGDSLIELYSYCKVRIVVELKRLTIREIKRHTKKENIENPKQRSHFMLFIICKYVLLSLPLHWNIIILYLLSIKLENH